MKKNWTYFILFIFMGNPLAAEISQGSSPTSEGSWGEYGEMTYNPPSFSGRIIINKPQNESSSLSNSSTAVSEIEESGSSWQCAEEHTIHKIKSNLLNTHRAITLLSLVIPGVLIHYTKDSSEMALIHAIFNSATLANLHCYSTFSIPAKNEIIARTLVTITAICLTTLTIFSWLHWQSETSQMAPIWILNLMNFFFVGFSIRVGMSIHEPARIILPLEYN